MSDSSACESWRVDHMKKKKFPPIQISAGGATGGRWTFLAAQAMEAKLLRKQ
jgi:hypothetical protein